VNQKQLSDHAVEVIAEFDPPIRTGALVLRRQRGVARKIVEAIEPWLKSGSYLILSSIDIHHLFFDGGV
jgi:hypothetical protein